LISVRATVDEENFGMMKTLYNTCMNETEIKAVGTAPLVALLDEFAKVFPIEDAAYSAGPNVTMADTKVVRETLLWMEKLGVGTIVSMGAGVDDKDPVSAAVRT
jgi:endothelin-converting enzyme